MLSGPEYRTGRELGVLIVLHRRTASRVLRARLADARHLLTRRGQGCVSRPAKPSVDLRHRLRVRWGMAAPEQLVRRSLAAPGARRVVRLEIRPCAPGK